VVIDRRSEAVQKGDGTESRASRARPVTVTGQARRSTEQPLYSRNEDPREGCDRAWAVGEEAAQSLRHGDRPLPHGHRGNDAVDEMLSCLRHPAAIARRTDTPALAASHRQGGPSMAPSCLAADGNAKGSHGCRARLSREATTKPCPHDAQRSLPNPKQRMPQVRYDRSSRSTCAETGCSATARFSSQPSRCSATLLVERRLLRPASLVAAGTHSADVRADFGPRRRRSQDGDHGRTGAWTGGVFSRTLRRRACPRTAARGLLPRCS
jgi:hypothetical protein